MSLLNKNGVIAMAIVLVFAGAVSRANAETVSFKVDLKASEEVPPNTSTGTGVADVTFDTTTKILKWKVTYSGLTGPAIMAHFHGPAEPGKTAAVVVPFANPASPIEGQTTLTDAQAADLMTGKWYVNVHTAQNKPGEIRGQVK